MVSSPSRVYTDFWQEFGPEIKFAVLLGSKNTVYMSTRPEKNHGQIKKNTGQYKNILQQTTKTIKDFIQLQTTTKQLQQTHETTTIRNQEQ